VNEAGNNVVAQLNAGNLNAVSGASVSFEAQQLVAAVLTTGEVNSVNALSTALSSTPGAPSVEATKRLASKLARLLADGQVNAEELLDAIRSYNEMIQQSNSEFLRNPPAELLAIQVALSRLIEAAGVG
jgi:methylglyoxal synthase